MPTWGSVQPSMIITQSKLYAEGRHAKAQCPICGDVILYKELKRDWRGVYVCPDCLDPRHPQEHILVYADPEALEHPAPLLDTNTASSLIRPERVSISLVLRQVTVVV